MDATDLARWTRFAGKGGIGKCTAVQDCVAEREEDLMFLKGDEITVLLQLSEGEGHFLGYCEGVVGRFESAHVQFHSKLKKPIMTKRLSSRSSTSSTAPSPMASSSELAALRAMVSSPTANVPSPSRHSSSVAQPIKVPVPEFISTPRSPVDGDFHLPPATTHSSWSPATEPVVVTPGDPPKPYITSEKDAVLSHLEVSPLDEGGRLSALAATVRDDTHSNYSFDRSPTTYASNRPSMTGSPSASASQRDSTDIYVEESTRISVALSDGEFGIGLSLLQDIASGDGDYDDDDESVASVRAAEVNTPPPAPSSYKDVFDSPSSTVEAHLTRTPPAESTTSPAVHTTATPTQQPPSRSSTHRSDSEAMDEEDWEGADDIYDDYRYSRFSMASKLSQFSKGSGQGGSKAPPVPNDSLPSFNQSRSSDVQSMHQSTQSTDSQYSVASTQADSPTKAVLPVVAPRRVNSLHASVIPPRPDESSQKRGRPAPLDLTLSPQTSLTSPQPSSFMRSPLQSPVVTTPTLGVAGAASTLRQQIEEGLGQPLANELVSTPTLDSHTEATTFARNIVIEDDEEIPDNTLGSPISLSSPQSSLYEPSSPLPSPHHSRPDTSSSNPSSSSYLPEKSPNNVEPIPTMIITNPSEQPPVSPLYTPVSTTVASSPVAISMPSTAPLTPRRPSIPSLPAPLLIPAPSTSPSPRPAPISPLSPKTPPGTTPQFPFLPHPNAPKSRLSTAGPPGQPPTHVQRSPGTAVSGSLLSTLRMAAAAGYHGQGGPPRRTTVYGLCERDLASAVGPVPISFSLEPPPSANSTHKVGNLANLHTPRRAFTTSASDGELAGNSIDPGENASPSPKNVIPRANFFPTVGKARPRSNSFSGFSTSFAEVPMPIENAREGVQPLRIPSVKSMMTRTPSTPGPSSLSSPVQKSPVAETRTSPRPPHAPSPLSLPQNNLVKLDTFALKSPPVSKPSTFSTDQSPPSVAPRPSINARSTSTSPKLGLRQVASSSGLRNNNTAPTPEVGPPSSFLSRRKSIEMPNSNTTSPTSYASDRESRSSIEKGSRLPPRSRSSTSHRRTRRSDDVETNAHYDERSLVASPPPIGGSSSSASSPMARTPSLRTKLSLSTLRSKAGNGRNGKEGSTETPLSSAPGTPLTDRFYDNETVQVQDMDFELIRPTLPANIFGNMSEDSLRNGNASKDRISIQSDRPDGFLRVGSPATSMLSGGGPPRSTSGHGTSEEDLPSRQKPPQNDPSMEAHRARELKWISAMSSVPASQAKKSKKIKKLLLEGVPSSVRYLVWAHLTDSGGRRMPGIYAALGKRDRVPASEEIDRDARRCFPDQPQLQNEKGPLVSLLQAYCTMVPDTRYQPGLAIIAGNLLQQSPEEDAFWIFLSLMDSYLRPYFASNGAQMEADASIFSKAIEGLDSSLAKKVFIDLGIRPISICGPWFSSLFAGVLPPEHLCRVWDVFLFEGPAYLFRVGIVLFLFSRRAVLESTTLTPSALLSSLHSRPAPTSGFPSDPEAFISLTLSVKVKDDDLRKQRTKLEAQFKRQTSAHARPAPGVTPGPPRPQTQTIISGPRI